MLNDDVDDDCDLGDDDDDENRVCLLADEHQKCADQGWRLDSPGHSEAGEVCDDDDIGDDDNDVGDNVDIDNDVDNDVVDDENPNLNSSYSEVINAVHGNLKIYILQRMGTCCT